MIKIKLENQFSDQTYSMVKSFVTRGDLLTYQNLEDLAESKNLDEIIIKMKGTKYGEVISKIQTPYNTRIVEKNLNRYLVDTHQSLMKVSPKKKLLRAYFLKYISGNLKILLKGRAQNKKDKDIEEYTDMYPEEKIGRRDLFARAFSAETLEQTITILKDSEFGIELEKAFNLFKKSGKFQIFDIYIDKAYYKGIIDAYFTQHKKDVYIRDILSIDVDTYNILSILRGKNWDIEPAEIKSFIVEPFFDINGGFLNKMIYSESLLDSVKVLTQSPYKKLISDIENFDDTLSEIEDNANVMFASRALRPFLWDIHKTSIILGGLKLIELEVKNLARIAFGVEQKIGFKKIMEKIIYFK